MSYALADSTGPLVEFGSIGGYADLQQWLRQQDSKVLKAFASRGWTEDLDDLIHDLNELSAPSNVLELVQILKETAPRAEDVLVVTDIQDEPLRALSALRETAVHRAADANVSKIEVAVRYAFAMGRRALNEGLDAQPVVNAIEAALDATLPRALYTTLVAGGHAGVQILQSEGLRVAAAKKQSPVSFVMKFDAKNKAAASWARSHAAETIEGISKTTRKMIREAVAAAQEGGSRKALFKTIFDLIGDRERAGKIARHQSMLAANEGQRQAWGQAKEKGLLSGKEKVVWITTEVGACPFCDALDGTTRKLSGEFPDPGGEGPPLHPDCRCTEGLAA